MTYHKFQFLCQKSWAASGAETAALAIHVPQHQPFQMGDNLPSVDLGTGHQAVQLSAGAYHTCAILDNGSAKCWGLNGGRYIYNDYYFLCIMYCRTLGSMTIGQCQLRMSVTRLGFVNY